MNATPRAIDVHAHFGDYRRDDAPPLMNNWVSGSAATVAERASRAKIRFTVVSPLSGLLPRGRADAVQANADASRVVRETPGLLQWVIAHPHQPDTFAQVEEMLGEPHCVGIKIHPEEHQYKIVVDLLGDF